MSSDPNDFGVIPPGQLLTLELLTAVLDPDLNHLKLKHLERWQLLQRVHRDLWKKWRDEYLHTLQQRHKWLDPVQLLRMGDLVLIQN
ncbi:hypothetical protein JTB14_026443 [Gonioctena quinquepunctata]|nr:hypothetical protein JTB14_026443 [Gonioctena quinquepunctata]